LFGFVTKQACDKQTDGRTDEQNYDSQDRAIIAASRGKNVSRMAIESTFRPQYLRLGVKARTSKARDLASEAKKAKDLLPKPKGDWDPKAEDLTVRVIARTKDSFTCTWSRKCIAHIMHD